MIVLKTITYFVVFLILWILIVSVFQALVQRLVQLIFNYDFVKDKKRGFVWRIVILSYVIPSVYITFQSLALINFLPPFFTEKKEINISNELKKAQKEYLSLLKRIEKTKREAIDAKINTDSLKEIELRRINNIIYQTSNIDRNKRYYTDLFISFIVGILSSLVATWLASRSYKKSK